jgi:hypothetical protein
LGYLLVVANPGTGYYAYSQASMHFDGSSETNENNEEEHIETHLVPVLGPL